MAKMTRETLAKILFKDRFTTKKTTYWDGSFCRTSCTYKNDSIHDEDFWELGFYPTKDKFQIEHNMVESFLNYQYHYLKENASPVIREILENTQYNSSWLNVPYDQQKQVDYILNSFLASAVAGKNEILIHNSDIITDATKDLLKNLGYTRTCVGYIFKKPSLGLPYKHLEVTLKDVDKIISPINNYKNNYFKAEDAYAVLCGLHIATAAALLSEVKTKNTYKIMHFRTSYGGSCYGKIKPYLIKFGAYFDDESFFLRKNHCLSDDSVICFISPTPI